MVTEKGMTIVDKETGEMAESHRAPMLVTPQAIQQTRQSIALLQQLVRDTLVRGRDYGTYPGIPGDFLFDPGASIIISSYNCRPGERRMIHFVDDGEKVAAVVEVPLISLVNGQVVGTGIGAASTQETKYKYRWELNPQDWGFNEEAIKTLKTRERDGKVYFRIPNPEHGELVNTIVKMASKRAEVDACETLPGVSSALRELFDSKGQRAARKQPDWDGFWNQVKKMGIDRNQVHELLEVYSMKQWLDQGKTLDDAIKVLSEKLAAGGSVKPPQKPKRDPNSIKTLTDLYNACHEDFEMQPADVVKELGYSTQMDISETPAEAYGIIASARG
jgi:hypothetical protein